MSKGRLSLAVGTLAGAPLLEAAGDVDFATLGELNDAVRQVLGKGSEITLLDLRRVRSMDAGAAGTLIEACRSLGPGRKLCAIARGQSEQVLRKVRLDSMMFVVGDADAAAELVRRVNSER
ncbi:MAG: hypothetical protein Q7T82_12610 [Armatimonadota bacterium]|nr:hypothetical protein [Armatimonadota bacterium]